ncbi:MAG: HD domain-containing protein, partial [Chitinophagaceae bacterium]|nr:HD domain-containing protein [Chitinophagaceae bacterium]
MQETEFQLLQEAQEYVRQLFKNKVDSKFVFHNFEHTQQVVSAADEMAAYYKLSDDDRLALLLAAWFHDTGFSSGKAEEHEKESTRIATEFLQQRGATPELVQRVSSCIQATRMPQSPLSQVEKILCDADLFHLGSHDSKIWTQRLKQEQENYFKKEFSKKEWRQRNIEFLESHQYFTDYAQERQEPKKQDWLKQLRKKQGDKEVKHTEEIEISPYSFTTEEDTKKEDNKKAAKTDKEAERGIQTMFRITSNNHFNLSSMADSKANIMISINSIILSILFSVLLGRLEYFPHLLYPTLLMST